jgi:hypothetical protein
MRSLSLIVFLTALLLTPFRSFAQDDLMALLEDEMKDENAIEYTIATFKGVRIANGQSIETPAGGVLQFIIAHRFGELNGGFYEIFGLDQANMRLELSYGITDWLSVGAARSNVGKTYDAFVKAKLLRQSTGGRKMPLSVTGFSGIAVNTLRWADPTRENYFSSRINYSFQLLLARKISNGFSLQLMPSMVHRNFVDSREAENDVFAIGIGARQKITPSITLNIEYYYLLPGHTADNFYNSLSIGMDIETGGHVFQFVLTNSLGMSENMFIPATTGNWLDGGIHFGFNIGRVFTVVDKSGIRNKEKKKKGSAED